MLQPKLLEQIIDVASIAAYKSSLLNGKGDKNAADQAAVDAMRQKLNDLNICGKVVIGEGEMDEAPMLYIGEILGKSKYPKIDATYIIAPLPPKKKRYMTKSSGTPRITVV